MARSERIYLVTEYDGHTDDPVVAAFTVKHELMTWLQKNKHREVVTYVIPDGGNGELKEFNQW